MATTKREGSNYAPFCGRGRRTVGSRYGPCLDMRMHLASRDIRSRCQMNSWSILAPRSPSTAGVGGLVEASMVIPSADGVLSSVNKAGCIDWESPFLPAAPQDGDNDFFLVSSSREYAMKSAFIQSRTELATRSCHTRSLAVPALHASATQ